jgi:CspA family cold shock protein
MQGVIKAYDPATGDGLVMSDTDLNDYELAADALAGSIFRMLRQGQRVVFDLEAALAGARLQEVDAVVQRFFEESAVEMLSVSPEDFAAAIQDALARREGAW